MRRIFPTQLKIVERASDLVPGEEVRKGYYKQDGKHVVQIAVSSRTNQLYLTAPGVWYRSYVFTIDMPSLLKRQQQQQQQSPNEYDDDDDDDDADSIEEGQVVESRTTQALWKLVATVVKTECGRKAVYHDGDAFLTVTNLTRDHTKQIYYLMKHVLTRMDVSFRVSSSWSTPSFTSTEVPDVRVKTRRRRKRKAPGPIGMETLPNNRWKHVQ